MDFLANLDVVANRPSNILVLYCLVDEKIGKYFENPRDRVDYRSHEAHLKNVERYPVLHHIDVEFAAHGLDLIQRLESFWVKLFSAEFKI